MLINIMNTHPASLFTTVSLPQTLIQSTFQSHAEDYTDMNHSSKLCFS